MRNDLEQSDVWVDINGAEHDVAKLSRRRAANIVRLLERRAGALHRAAVGEFPISPYGDQLEDEFERLVCADPGRWLREQKLYLAMVERAAGHKGGPSLTWLAQHPVFAARYVRGKLA